MTRAPKAIFITFSLAAVLVVFATAAAAQAHGSAHAAPAPARAGVLRAPQRMVATPLQPNFAPIRGVPGLGFSFDSLAATQRRGPGRPRRGQSVTPLLWYSPFYSPYVDYSYDAAQPPYADQPPPAQYAPPAPQAAPSEPAPGNAELEPPPPDVGQFVLVRLDGQIVFAAAFTAVNGSVTYITREGIRRSFPLAELDRQATLQMNEANGSSVSLPD